MDALILALQASRGNVSLHAGLRELEAPPLVAGGPQSGGESPWGEGWLPAQGPQQGFLSVLRATSSRSGSHFSVQLISESGVGPHSYFILVFHSLAVS